MSSFYLAVGWIIVVGFGITFVITLLGLIRINGRSVIEIQERYMKILFSKLILEIIAAGFFIFYQGGTPTLKPQIDPTDVYVFDKHGEPLQDLEIVVGGMTPIKFERMPDTAFKTIRRAVEISGDTIYVTNESMTTYLGYVENAATKLQDLLTAEHALQLGLHLSEFKDKQQKIRRDAPNAVKYLKLALTSGIKNSDAREGAVQQLYHLTNFFENENDFRFLIKMYKFRKGNIKYRELGDLNFVAAERIEFSKNIRNEFRKASLKDYLRYLKIQKPKDKEVNKLRGESKKQIKILVNHLRRVDDAIKAKSEDILSAVKNDNEFEIEKLIDFIASK
jgi:hypothetical protein